MKPDKKTEAQKRRARIEKYIVLCPHCNKEVLDHMTVCPHCKGELSPRGYTPIMDPETRKKVKRISTIILSTIALIVIIFVLIKRNS